MRKLPFISATCFLTAAAASVRKAVPPATGSRLPVPLTGGAPPLPAPSKLPYTARAFSLFPTLFLHLLTLLPASALLDSNNNGISDLVETAWNGGQMPATPYDPAEDPDADGWNNGQEALSGTDPFSASPSDYGFLVPAIEIVPAVYMDNNGVTGLVTPEIALITWVSLPGKAYQVFWSATLAADSWLAVSEPLVATGAEMGKAVTLTQNDGGVPERLFFRVSITDTDTDGDGLNDHEEALAATDPFKPDTDGDGVRDFGELSATHTSPLLAADTDGDAIPDDLGKYLAVQFLALHPAVDYWGAPVHAALMAGNLDPSATYPGVGAPVPEMVDLHISLATYPPGTDVVFIQPQHHTNSLGGSSAPGYPGQAATVTGNYGYSISGNQSGSQPLTSPADLDPSYLSSRIGNLPWFGSYDETVYPYRSHEWMVGDGYTTFSSVESAPGAVEAGGTMEHRRFRLVAPGLRHPPITYHYVIAGTTESLEDGATEQLVATRTETLTIPDGSLFSEWIAFEPEITGGTIKRQRVIPFAAAVDLNRDGRIIPYTGEDTTTGRTPYRFWLNNDHDLYGGDTYDAAHDHPWTTRPVDNADDQMGTERDLEDYARLHLDVGGLRPQLEAGTLTLALKWKTTQAGAPGIRLYKAVEAGGGTKYLSDPAEAAAQVANGSGSIGAVQGAAECVLPLSFWTSTSAGTVKHLLYEGLAEGKGSLVLVLRKDGALLAESGPVFLELLDIRKMYERWKIREAAVIEDPDKVAVATVFGVEAVPDPYDHPFQPAWDEDTAVKSYVICVHGWRKSYVAARSDEITLFKRLWHRGFKGRYIGFRWPTLEGGEIAAKFNHSEYRAWKCGAAFKEMVETKLPAGYRKNVIAHSLGNVVVSSALAQGLALNYYALLNGAIPAQCFDPDPALKQVPATQTLVIDDYPDIDYPAWAGDDLGDDPALALSALSYRNRVVLGPNTTTTLVNFYLPEDEALIGGWEANQWGAGDNWPLIDSKPIDGYCYDFGIRLNYDPVGFGDRALTDPHEAMSMTNRSMTKAVGAEGRTRGAIKESVNMGSLDINFGKKHEAIFMFRCHSTWIFYGILMDKLEYSPTP